MKRIYQASRVYRFRRFSRKAYAAFASLHRQVSIGRIAGEIADLELLKAGKKTALGLLLALSAAVAYAEESDPDPEPAEAPANLDEVLVRPQVSRRQLNAYHLVAVLERETLEALPVQSTAELLQYLPGLDIRTRGACGAQADLTMRGGTADQTLILVNGVNLSDPQTGHYALNLPVSAAQIERIEVLEASEAVYYGSGAFSGAVNIITRPLVPVQKHRTVIGLSGGMYGWISHYAASQWKKGAWRGSVSGEYNRSDGYMDNTDLWTAQAFAEASGQGWDIQLGVQAKDAGANAFYSLLSTDQFDATRTVFTSVKHQWRTGRWVHETGGSWRMNQDRYEWHRGTPSNLHLSNSGTLHLHTTRHYKIGKTFIGLILRDDDVHSTVLGDADPRAVDIDFDHPDWLRLPCHKNRLSVEASAAQSFAVEDLTLSLALNAHWDNLAGWNAGGSALAGWRFNSRGLVRIGAHRAVRMPTFTDLYYHSATQQANPALKAETAWNLGLAAHYTGTHWQIQADLYRRWGNNMIDWVKQPGETVWQAANLTSVNSTGCEVQAVYRLNRWLQEVRFSYAFCVNDKTAGERLSLYALDFLRHKAVIGIRHGLGHGWGAAWTLTYTQRNGSQEVAGGRILHQPAGWMLDGKLFWETKRFHASLGCTNMTNRTWYGQGGVLQPGWNLKATFRIKL